ncbi:unnamed protein product [Ectocarpus sp. 12 AP-2014]
MAKGNGVKEEVESRVGKGPRPAPEVKSVRCLNATVREDVSRVGNESDWMNTLRKKGRILNAEAGHRASLHISVQAVKENLSRPQADRQEAPPTSTAAPTAAARTTTTHALHLRRE